MYPTIYTLPYRGFGLAIVTFIPATGSSRANVYNKMGFVFIVPEIFYVSIIRCCRSQWPRGLRRGSAAFRLLRSWV